MPRCSRCGESSAFLLLTEDGLCRPCEIERQITEHEDFQISKTFYVFLPNNYIFFVGLDDARKRFAICAQTMSKPVRVYFYDYADLIQFETSESETPKNMCNAMMMNVYLSSLERPHVSFYLINKPVQFGSKAYHAAVRTSGKINGILMFLKHNGALQQAERRPLQQVVYVGQLPEAQLNALGIAPNAAPQIQAAYANVAPIAAEAGMAAAQMAVAPVSEPVVETVPEPVPVPEPVAETSPETEPMKAPEPEPVTETAAKPARKKGKAAKEAEQEAQAVEDAIEEPEEQEEFPEAEEESAPPRRKLFGKKIEVETDEMAEAVRDTAEAVEDTEEEKEGIAERMKKFFGMQAWEGGAEVREVPAAQPQAEAKEPAASENTMPDEATKEFEGGAITDTILDAVGSFAGKISGLFKRKAE